MKVQKIKRDVNDRKGIIGGSSIGAILGLSTYKSEHDAWEDFVGKKTEPVSPEVQERFDMGHALEGFIASQVERIYGVKLRVCNYAYVHPKHKWLICHPDRLVVGKIDGKVTAVEIKSSSVYDNGRWGDPDTDEVPMDYLCQCHDYIMCGVCEVVWLIRFSNNRITRYIITADGVLEETILVKLIDWVNKVAEGYEPPYSDYKQASLAFKGETDGELEATAEIYDIVEQLRVQQRIEKEADDAINKLKAQIVSYMGDSKKKLLMYQGKKIGSWFMTTKTSFDSKAFKEAEPDLYKKYEKTSSFMQFR